MTPLYEVSPTSWATWKQECEIFSCLVALSLESGSEQVCKKCLWNKRSVKSKSLWILGSWWRHLKDQRIMRKYLQFTCFCSSISLFSIHSLAIFNASFNLVGIWKKRKCILYWIKWLESLPNPGFNVGAVGHQEVGHLEWNQLQAVHLNLVLAIFGNPSTLSSSAFFFFYQWVYKTNT